MVVYCYMTMLFTAHNAIVMPVDLRQIMEMVSEDTSTDEAMCAGWKLEGTQTLQQLSELDCSN